MNSQTLIKFMGRLIKDSEKNCFYSIKKERTSTIKVKRSIFTCTISHSASIDEAKQFIARVAKENKTATHNCWAYVLGDKGQIFHSSDAGEPAGTAGKPILNTLQRYRMTWVGAVVTRHFGGVQLGVRGLIDAYGESVQDAIGKKRLKKVIQVAKLNIEVSYDFNDTLLNLIKKSLVSVDNTIYAEKVVHTIEIVKEHEHEVIEMLTSYQAMGKLKFGENLNLK